MISDLGGGNRGLRNDLGISENNNNFLNPVTAKNIYIFGDAPHLIQLLRNHFLILDF